MPVPFSALPVPFSALVLIAMLATPAVSRGQSIVLSKSAQNERRSWPAPVRDAAVRPLQHLEVADAVPLTAVPANALRVSHAPLVASPASPHRVIQPPSRRPTAGKDGSGHPRIHDPHYWSRYHRPIQPAPARLPDANQRETWKSPYSYGYFGASGARHWKMHNGYRDRYTEWRLD